MGPWEEGESTRRALVYQRPCVLVSVGLAGNGWLLGCRVVGVVVGVVEGLFCLFQGARTSFAWMRFTDLSRYFQPPGPSNVYPTTASRDCPRGVVMFTVTSVV